MNKKPKIVLAALCAMGIMLVGIFFIFRNSHYPTVSYLKEQMANAQSALLPEKNEAGELLYRGHISHIFFHSLIVYPQLAYNGTKHSQLYKDYMVTRDQFEKMLPDLYANNYVLIDAHALYSTNPDGTITKKKLYLPPGKKPLIISIDDLSYYRSQHGNGFANKLVLDAEGKVATEIITPEGKTIVTRDGDLVPILDDFVSAHPDFSIDGAKGIIALTGFDGVLGYQTEASTSPTFVEDSISAKKIITVLKNTGWSFASHSYSHETAFRTGTLSLDQLKKDTELWNREVRPLVGNTDMFIGPFGQIFKDKDPRRDFLVQAGFHMLFGVGMDEYFNYYSTYVMQDRADIDGYRLLHNATLLKRYFNTDKVLSQ